MKNLLLVAASGLALGLTSAPALAQDAEGQDEEVFVFQTEEEEEIEKLTQEMTDAFAIFGEMFAADPLTEEQEARLPLAQQMTDKVFPEGTFGVVMQQSMAPMMDAIMGTVTQDPRTGLAELSGVSAEELGEIDDEAAQAALDLLDPQYAARVDGMSLLLTDMIGEMFDAMEPAYREALARAFATRFEDAEIEELLVFFETPIGGKFARESFLVQYDPQMLGVMEAMGPAMGQILPGMMEKFAAFEEEFPDGRRFPDLSGPEKEDLARLLGKSESELEALAPDPAEEEVDEEEPVV